MPPGNTPKNKQYLESRFLEVGSRIMFKWVPATVTKLNYVKQKGRVDATVQYLSGTTFNVSWYSTEKIEVLPARPSRISA